MFDPPDVVSVNAAVTLSDAGCVTGRGVGTVEPATTTGPRMSPPGRFSTKSPDVARLWSAGVPLSATNTRTRVCGEFTTPVMSHRYGELTAPLAMVVQLWPKSWLYWSVVFAIE